jgi:glycosyltransferase involved in cell wall biosynthesis
MKILYSFPHKLGAERICYTAWQQVHGLAAAGADVLVFPGAVHKAVPASVVVRPTLARGKVRLPYRVLGTERTCALHDYIVAERLERLAGEIDIVHVWPLGALRTLKAARRLGIPTVLERPNAHTRFAFEVVDRECQRLGVALPPGHEHGLNEQKFRIEDEEFELADYLLCPSDFVRRTYMDRGYPASKLLRHRYGFDEKRYHPGDRPATAGRGLTMLFVGVGAVRKGLHFALEAWLRSPAHREGTFLVAGEILDSYAHKMRDLLSHPSVQVLGHRSDVAELMRRSDILVLPSLEEGSALVTSEARGSGCVLLVSDAAGAVCEHMKNALVHEAGDVAGLTAHMTMLHEDRDLLASLRAASLGTTGDITWNAAGVRLLQVYRDVVNTWQSHTQPVSA